MTAKAYLKLLEYLAGKRLTLPNNTKNNGERGFYIMKKKAPPPSVIHDFARQVWLIVQPKEDWVYHGDFIVSAKPQEIVCRCYGFGTGKIDLYEIDQMYGVGRCMECFRMHWYNLI